MARRTGSSGERTAREIRAAARRLFAERGYAAVSMRQIAQAVGVGAGALYLYTPDKQSLLADMMIEHLEELLTAWQAEHQPDQPPRTRLQRFMRFHIRHHLARSDEEFIVNKELRNLSPENFARVERLRRLYENVLEEILHDGAEAGDFRLSDPRIGTLGLISMLTGIGARNRAGSGMPPSRVEKIYGEMALAAVGAV